MHHPNHQHLKNSGGALISALFITAIAAIIATALAVQVRLLIHEGELVVNSDQSYLNCQSMQLLAENEVIKYVSQWTNVKTPSPQLILLKTKLPNTKINGTQLTGDIDDEQGKFNINDLVYTANQSRFVTLLQAVVQGISQQQSFNIAKAITAWMTNDSQNKYYLSLHPPYQSPQAEMTDISELRLVEGVTPEIYSALAPYITALPITPPSMLTSKTPPETPTTPPSKTPTSKTSPETPININSASAQVLLTTNPALTIGQAENLVTCRIRFGGFTSTQAFQTDCVQPASIPALTDITTESNYFLTHVYALWNNHTVSLNSLLVTQIQKNNTLKAIVVWQEFD